MFAYALARLDRLGVRPRAPGRGAARVIGALESMVGAETWAGRGAALPRICHVAGLGGFGGRYRDGTPAYYIDAKRSSATT